MGLNGYLRGDPLTIGLLKGMSDGDVVWVCYHELANPEGSRVDAPSRIEWTGKGDLILDDVGMDFDPGTFPDDAECFDEGFGEVDMRLYKAIEDVGLAWKPVTPDLRKEVRPECGDIPRSWKWTTLVNGVRVFKNMQAVNLWLPVEKCWMGGTPKRGQSFDDVARILVARR
jgi:hypothetical protein